MRKLLQSLFLFGNLIATIYAMDPPMNTSITTGTHLIIKASDYGDPTTPQKLRNNSSVVDLTLQDMPPESFYCHDHGHTHDIYKRVILEGLQNKPNLKRLTTERFTIGLFCNYSCCLDPNNNIVSKRTFCLSLDKNPPADLLKLAHLACFSNLEQLKIENLEACAYNWELFFLNHFINSQVLPNLKQFKVESHNIDREFLNQIPEKATFQEEQIQIKMVMDCADVWTNKGRVANNTVEQMTPLFIEFSRLNNKGWSDITCERIAEHLLNGRNF